MSIHITKADLNSADKVAKLFNAYRIFYGQDNDLALAQSFINQRIEKQDSVIFLAQNGQNKPVGFTQLYPSFSSVSAMRTWILNDLYVAEDARRAGVAKQLMLAAKLHAEATQAKGISLATAVDNTAAKALYDTLGYKKNDTFDYYFLTV